VAAAVARQHLLELVHHASVSVSCLYFECFWQQLTYSFVGSDIAGSIRVPSHFVGIFGHKPTAGVISVDGHFPNSTDKNFIKFLTIGPMCRYAKDLPTLTQIMANDNYRSQLRLDQPIHTKDIDIFVLTTASSHSWSLWNVDGLIQRRMLDAAAHFKSNGVNVQHLNESLNCDDATFVDMSDALEISICTFFTIEDIPDLLSNCGASVSEPFERILLKFFDFLFLLLAFEREEKNDLFFYQSPA
jgi:hypothetical protein